MRWHRLGVVFAIVALVGGLALWVSRGRAPETAISPQGQALDRAFAPVRMRVPELPAPGLAWLWQKGVAHRVAGHVVHAGRPVGGAVVRLTTEELRIGEWVLAEVETDDEGRFDFGPRPGTRYQVVAQAKGLVAGGVVLELRARDPRPPPGDVTIELRDCELVVSGIVSDAAGGVIAGARVRAATRSEVFGGVLSDEQGRYEVCLLAGPAHIEAAADGYGTALEHTRGRRAARVDFALSPEIAIAGRVVDEAGAPVGGAVVIAETNGHDPGQLTESAENGGFRIEGLIAGTYRVVARDDDRAADTTVTLGAAGATTEITLTLERRATLTGRVVVGGKPTAEATVVAKSTDESWTLGSAVTLADGRFAIAGLPRGQVKLDVEKHRLVSPAATIDVGEVGQVELVCERLATVSGRVMRGGKAVAHAEVRLEQERWRRTLTLSRDDGTFQLEGVEPATYDILATSAAESAGSERRPVSVGAQDVGGLVLELDITASVAGSVVDAKGAPVGGVKVGLEREGSENGPDESASDTTAADGSFLVSVLAAGRYVPRVYRSRNGWINYPPPGGGRHPVVQVADASSRVTDVRLTIAPADLTISGRVARRGEPVAGLDITAISSEGGEANAQSGADGTFVLEGLTAGRYSLHTRSGGSPLTSVEAGARDVVVELPPTGAIEGVLRGFSSSPEITLRSESSHRQADVTDSKFTVADLPAGAYEVSAIAPSGQHAAARVEVTADQVSRLTLTAGATGTITGAVVDLRTRAAIPGVHCIFPIDGGDAARRAETDATGRFSLAVPAGAITVQCFGRRSAMQSARTVSVEVRPGATANVTVEVVTMRMRNPSGEIGIDLEEVSPGTHRIQSLRRAAASSGLRVGDVVLAVDGLSTARMDSHVVHALMLDREVGSAARLTVDRQGTQMDFDVVVEAPLPGVPDQ